MTHLSCYRKAKRWLSAFASCNDPLANENPISLDKKACAELATILTLALPGLEDMAMSKKPGETKCSRLRVKRARDYACFDYPVYLNRQDKVLDKKPKGCPYDLGDVVVVEETQAVGVVLGCICEDGDLRTDADGMRCWSVAGYLRFATIEDVRTLRCSDKLKKEFGCVI